MFLESKMISKEVGNYVCSDYKNYIFTRFILGSYFSRVWFILFIFAKELKSKIPLKSIPVKINAPAQFLFNKLIDKLIVRDKT